MRAPFVAFVCLVSPTFVWGMRAPFVAFVCLVSPTFVWGHAVMTSPSPRPASGMIGTGSKLQPFAGASAYANGGCGSATNGDPGVQIPTVAYTPGAQVTVTWALTIPHPADNLDSGVRIAMHYGPGDSFDQNILTGGVIGSGAPGTVSAELTTVTVTLPAKTCDYCTLQWLWAANADGGSYIGCSDVAITANGALPNYVGLPSQVGNVLPGVLATPGAGGSTNPGSIIVPAQDPGQVPPGGTGPGDMVVLAQFTLSGTLDSLTRQQRSNVEQGVAVAAGVSLEDMEMRYEAGEDGSAISGGVRVTAVVTPPVGSTSSSILLNLQTIVGTAIQATAQFGVGVTADPTIYETTAELAGMGDSSGGMSRWGVAAVVLVIFLFLVAAYFAYKKFCAGDSGGKAPPPPGVTLNAPPPPSGQPPGGALPPGWQAVFDPTSGQTFFCNSMTGATTWNHPSGAV